MTRLTCGKKIRMLSALCFLCLFRFAGYSEASITTLTESAFLDLAPQGLLYVETLEAYPAGAADLPLDLVNGQFSVESGIATIDTVYRAGQFTNILRGSSITAGRTFTLFPDSTVAWAADLAMEAIGLGPQSIEVKVIGNSGTATFYFDRNDIDPYFAGFYDPSGLVSLEFMNLGFNTADGTQYSNYNFDDIMTLSRVPLPPAVWLFATGLIPLAIVHGNRFRKPR